MSSLVEFLESVQIFSSLSEQGRAEVAKCLRNIPVEGGEVLFRQGDGGDELFVVQEGSVSISVQTSDGEALEVATFSTGDFFGEMSIFDNSPRSATCAVKEGGSLLSLRGDDFRSFATDQPEIAIEVMRKMLDITTGRLENTGAFLSGMVQWGEGARKRAITDDFTGLYNRRFLDDTLAEQFARARAERKSLSIVMCDLDRFGTINNAYGHEMGDKVILAAVPVFQSCFRESDILCRYGGDEFTFLLPDTDGPTALEIARNVCEAMRKVDILRDMSGPITGVSTSQGVASFPRDARDLKELLERADAALYRAKEQGRDQAVLYQADEETGDGI